LDSLDVQPQSDLARELIKVRCPKCLKLYAVAANEIHESKPHFSCGKCSTEFWFAYPESLGQVEVVGFPVVWLEPAATPAAREKALDPRLFHCPRCEAAYHQRDKECPKCGVVFAKLDFSEGQGPTPASPGLRRLWRDVVENYANLEIHHRFLALAQREENLPYATHQYGKLLEAHSGDDMALRMQQEILALTETQMKSNSAPRRRFQFFPKVGTLVLMAGGALIAAGFMMPAARNLIGLGAAVVFFTLALEWVFRK
jgi:hypothetical protein